KHKRDPSQCCTNTDDHVDILSRSVGRPHGSTGPSSFVQDTTGDAIDRDFFPFLPDPYYADYHEDGIIGESYEIIREEWERPHEPTFNVLSKELFKDPKVCKTMVDQFPSLLDDVSDLKRQVVGLNEKVKVFDDAFVEAKSKSKARKKKIKSLSKTLDQFTAEATRLASDLNEVRRVDARK
ncbi:hypothetical protein Tco_1450405, partial [Tanacetum coccineum]